MLISQLLRQGKAQLEKEGVTNADIDVQLLLGHCLRKSRTQLFLNASVSAEPNESKQFWSLIQRRAAREPVAYILGEREFWSMPFYVNTDVLIPRPETEFLLETVLQKVKNLGLHVQNALDLCCGSGVIAIVLALELRTHVLAVDLSEKALAVSHKNCRRYGLKKNISLRQSDLFSELSAADKYQLIVSNPPYVSRGELESGLDPEVVDFEPHLALDGGDDGLDIIRQIAAGILCHLTPGGLFFMEFGAEQGAQVKAIFSSTTSSDRSFQFVEIFRDYSGRDRVLSARANNYCE